MIDSATNLTEEYTWNADNTLATMPGPSYTREFGYNEESQLLSISHSGTLAYQYAYGADGNRRWAKDIANNKWTWYPCGVACGAGELVEQGSDLTGATWATNAQYLRAGGGCSSMLIRRKSSTDDEYHHVDLLGGFGVITGATGAVLSSNVYDAFVNAQYVANNARIAQPVVCYKAMSEPGLLTGSGGRGVVVPSRGFQVMGNKPAPVKKQACGFVLICLGTCMALFKGNYTFCANFCLDVSRAGCSAGWKICLRLPEPQSDSCVELLLRAGCL